MHEVLSLATQVAMADVPVLITGPNGSGKDVVARVIQTNSKRNKQPFVTVNVGALPKELMEAELFGAEAGAFTGAVKRREGRFEAADGGTLFLDEIGNLSLEGQMKLLRILQTGEYERLGSSSTRTVNVRIISATNTDLVEAIKNGSFREDLYYRLNLIEIPVPALSERPDDILPLADHFLDDQHELSDQARDALLSHQWPGNVRELQNLIQRAGILAGGKVISLDSLGGSFSSNNETKAASTEPDQNLIQQTLENCSGNVSTAARELGLSRQALYRRMEKYGLV